MRQMTAEGETAVYELIVSGLQHLGDGQAQQFGVGRQWWPSDAPSADHVVVQEAVQCGQKGV